MKKIEDISRNYLVINHCFCPIRSVSLSINSVDCDQEIKMSRYLKFQILAYCSFFASTSGIQIKNVLMPQKHLTSFDFSSEYLQKKKRIKKS